RSEVVRRRRVAYLGATGALTQGEAAQALLLEQPAAGGNQRFTKVAVMVGGFLHGFGYHCFCFLSGARLSRTRSCPRQLEHAGRLSLPAFGTVCNCTFDARTLGDGRCR